MQIYSINRRLIFFIILLIPAMRVTSQTADGNETLFLNGFSRKISGDDFTYHSSIPVANSCMLIRATDGNSFMEWETAPVPSGVQKPYVTFVWLAGIGSSPGVAAFDVEINGIRKFTFLTDGADNFLHQHTDGSSLAFHNDMTDQHGDRFGFIYLKIPSQQDRKSTRLNSSHT